jgi:uncharacterized membrane protein YbhN (UPF0104 family)
VKNAATIALTAAKFIIPTLIIAWLLWRVETHQWEDLRNRPKNYPLLVAALSAAIAALSLSFFRWWMLVRSQGIQLGVIEAFRLSAISFLLSFVSAGSVGGDLFKMIFLARRSPGKGIEAVASVVVDRGVGLLGLLLLVAVALQIAGQTANADLAKIGDASLVLAGVGCVLLAILILGGRPIDHMIVRASGLPYVGGTVNRIAGPLRVFHRHPLVFAISLLLSLAVHILLAVSAFWIATALYGVDAPSLADHTLIFPIACLAAALPIAPAGLGVFEGAMEWLYQVVPSQPTIASGTLVALVFEIVKVIMAILGMIFYWTASPDIRGSLNEVQAADRDNPSMA